MSSRNRELSDQFTFWFLAALTLLALSLRLLLVYWHRQYPLSGDEIGFFEQARTFVQGRGYQDLELMRGPLYPLFLAVIFRLFGAEVAAARIVQSLLGAATVPLLYLWTARRFDSRRAGLLAAALGALLFPLAVQATYLLTETLFLFLFVLGMMLLDWGMERQGARDRGQGRRLAWVLPLLVGVIFGLATLTRSIGLPLVGVGMLGFLRPFRSRGVQNELDKPAPPGPPASGGEAKILERVSFPRSRGGDQGSSLHPLFPSLLVLLGALAVILPWTVRNALVYNSFILVDTTGATNLWLDNDPALGRDKVKAELLKYPEGQRQGLSVRNGLASISANPAWFAGKAWGEVKNFFALEYFDDLLDRPAIWYPLGEVWQRVLLGDGLYLLLLVLGAVGLLGSRVRGQFLDLLWLLYVPATTTLFHVELRYRLPFLSVLVPYAALALARPRAVLSLLRSRPVRAVAAVLLVVALAGVLLAHSNYPRLAGQVAVKRIQVLLGRGALSRGDPASAEQHSRAGLAAYPDSTEAAVLLAQSLRAQGRSSEAEEALHQAIDVRSGPPHPHLLLGDLLRARGKPGQAARELAYESHSLEDLQGWAWANFSSTAPAEIDIGGGLALGWLRGWHLPEQTGDGVSFRWSMARSTFRLAAPEGGSLRLVLRLSAGRPADLSLPEAVLRLNGREVGRFTVENGWREYTVDVGEVSAGQELVFELRTATWRPHQYDRTLDDNRALGVMVDWVKVQGPSPKAQVPFSKVRLTSEARHCIMKQARIG